MNYTQDTTPGASDVPLQPARLPATQPALFPSQNSQSPNAFFKYHSEMSPRPRLCNPRRKSGGERRIRAAGWGGGGWLRSSSGEVDGGRLAIWQSHQEERFFTRLTFTCLRAVNKKKKNLLPAFAADEPPRGRRSRRGRTEARRSDGEIWESVFVRRRPRPCIHTSFFPSVKPPDGQRCVEGTCVIPSRQVVRFFLVYVFFLEWPTYGKLAPEHKVAMQAFEKCHGLIKPQSIQSTVQHMKYFDIFQSFSSAVSAD